MSQSSSSPYLDSRGCLSPAGIAAMAEFAPGQAPPELARHLATCARCQERMLLAGGTRRRGRRPPALLPSLGRAVLLIVLLLAAIGVFLLTLRRLAGG